MQMGQGQLTFKCLYDSECQGIFTPAERRYYMTRRMAERASIAEAALSVSNAKIENLVSCPRCIYAEVHDEPQGILQCMNKKCLAITCTNCFRDAHIGKDCVMDDNLEKRKRYEEERTRQSIFQCPGCTVAISKDGGCNKIKCPCGVSVCYLCKKDISEESYRHFRDSADKGCILFDDVDETDYGYGEYDISSSEEESSDESEDDEPEDRHVYTITDAYDALDRIDKVTEDFRRLVSTPQGYVPAHRRIWKESPVHRRA
jgi:hypothetical protein